MITKNGSGTAPQEPTQNPDLDEALSRLGADGTVEPARIAQLASALDVLGEAFVIYDAEGCLVFCNRAFRDIYGYTEDEARPGAHFRDLGRIDVERGNVVVGDEYGSGEDYLDRKAEYRRTLMGSFTVRLKDGRWLKTTDRAMPGGGFVSVQADVTELKQAEMEMAEAKQEAERSNLAKSDFLAKMSHDLRTPLNSIIGFSELIAGFEDLGPNRERIRSYADAVTLAGAQLNDLIGDILDISRVEAGKLTLDEGAVDIVGELQTCIDQVRKASGNGHLKTCGIDAPSRPMLRGDARRLRQVFTNLLSNGFKFTPEDGRIAVTVADEGQAGLRIEVADNGSGIPTDELQRVLLPFEQAGGRHQWTAKGAGSGLGLAIAKSLVDLHNGSLTLDSSLGEGTRVTVRFPADRVTTATVSDGRPLHD
ncbi:MAG: ATP-binding protein [Alphaproteobacteria bacterium]|nr:ATP-binding protein [Alphaproteobacteria bacterium]